MEQREITDKENTTWTCVQAYAGIENSTEKDIIGKNGDGTVTVVCTPSGGAQTVRLKLKPDWLETETDEGIANKIMAAK
jgi:DNA-binding protein YbaB